MSGEDKLQAYLRGISIEFDRNHSQTLIDAGCDTLDSLKSFGHADMLQLVDTLVEVEIPRNDAEKIVQALQNEDGNDQLKEEVEPQGEMNDALNDHEEVMIEVD
eukprot:188965_1